MWVASRASGVDAVLDVAGSNWLSNVPSPAIVQRLLPGLSSTHFDTEGTLGDELPTLLLGFPVGPPNASAIERLRADRAAAETAEAVAVRKRRYREAAEHAARADALRRATVEAVGAAERFERHGANDSVRLWQMAAVPVDAGFDQRVMWRFVAVNGSGRVAALYFDTFAYVPSVCTDDDSNAGCMPPASFYSALLDQHFAWAATWRNEGRMQLALPAAPPTSGEHLMRQAHHCLTLDMITRSGGVWPRYGTAPGYEQLLRLLARRVIAEVHAAAEHRKACNARQSHLLLVRVENLLRRILSHHSLLLLDGCPLKLLLSSSLLLLV